MTLRDRIIEFLLRDTTTEIRKLEAVVQASHASAINSELQAESQYDTQSIEAGYLLSGHAQRLAALREELSKLTALKIGGTTTKSSKATLGSLVTLKNEDGAEEQIFLSPATAPKNTLRIDDVEVKIISTRSPLGQEILGLESGDTFELETPAGSVGYDVRKVG